MGSDISIQPAQLLGLGRGLTYFLHSRQVSLFKIFRKKSDNQNFQIHRLVCAFGVN